MRFFLKTITDTKLASRVYRTPYTLSSSIGEYWLLEYGHIFPAKATRLQIATCYLRPDTPKFQHIGEEEASKNMKMLARYQSIGGK